ncbi:hypothetical protein ABIB68_000004 [Bradyrhizobium sp. F1.2.2]
MHSTRNVGSLPSGEGVQRAEAVQRHRTFGCVQEALAYDVAELPVRAIKLISRLKLGAGIPRSVEYPNKIIVVFHGSSILNQTRMVRPLPQRRGRECSVLRWRTSEIARFKASRRAAMPLIRRAAC